METVDKAAFNRFLDDLQGDSSVTDLVLLGDVVDMWRRDASGVFLENKDTFDKVMNLQKKMRVHYIAGNHDYHVLKLQGHAYPLQFLRDLSLSEGNVNYVFKHGYEFDEMQREHFMESLCHAMSDAKGERDNNIWSALSRDKGDIGYAFAVIFRRAELHRQAALLFLDPEERLGSEMNRVEKRARASVKPGEVFGRGPKPPHEPGLGHQVERFGRFVEEDYSTMGEYVKSRLEGVFQPPGALRQSADFAEFPREKRYNQARFAEIGDAQHQRICFFGRHGQV